MGRRYRFGACRIASEYEVTLGRGPCAVGHVPGVNYACEKEVECVLSRGRDLLCLRPFCSQKS